jgi:hypothetical protein
VLNIDFYDNDAVRQLATNLFYGWGYNFYRVENQLRADDQMVRSKAAWLLGMAMANVCTAESDYRREFLPAPTRAKPFPDAAAVSAAQRLERLAKAIGGLEASILQQPVPENDRMTQRYRLEAPTLARLMEFDHLLVGQCELLRSLVDGQDAASILKSLPELDAGLNVIHGTLHNRQSVLQDPA